jgi:cell division protein FtsB
MESMDQGLEILARLAGGASNGALPSIMVVIILIVTAWFKFSIERLKLDLEKDREIQRQNTGLMQEYRTQLDGYRNQHDALRKDNLDLERQVSDLKSNVRQLQTIIDKLMAVTWNFQIQSIALIAQIRSIDNETANLFKSYVDDLTARLSYIVGDQEPLNISIVEADENSATKETHS